MEVITLNFCDPFGLQNYILVRVYYIIKMSLELFHKVTARAIERLFDEQKQPLFKRADLGKYLGIEKMKDNFKNFPSHYACARSEIEGACLTCLLGRVKNPHDVFINLNGSIEMALRSKKRKAEALVKWLNKKGVEKIQEEHRLAITDCDNQMQVLEFTNEKNQQKILRHNEEIDDLVASRHVTRRGSFDNVLYFIKKNS